MLVSEFIKKKNQILRDYTNIDFDLVPKEQIKECKQFPLSMENTHKNCPYCRAYNDWGDCQLCPMALANNECNINENNTWDRYYDLTQAEHIDKQSKAYKPMCELIEQYNKELKCR